MAIAARMPTTAIATSSSISVMPAAREAGSLRAILFDLSVALMGRNANHLRARRRRGPIERHVHLLPRLHLRYRRGRRAARGDLIGAPVDRNRIPTRDGRDLTRH